MSVIVPLFSTGVDKNNCNFIFVIDLSLLEWEYISGAAMGKIVAFKITVLLGKVRKTEIFGESCYCQQR
jgi:hypothetical protein